MKLCGTAYFPSPLGLNINMMPFIMGKARTLPVNVRQYLPMIRQCDESSKGQFNGSVCYLTIHESFIEEGQTQRRGGVHTEASKKGRWGGGWGRDGVWMASTVNKSCRVWPNEPVPSELLGEGGCCKHLKLSRNYVDLPSNSIVRIGDNIPHQSLPQRSGYRQFFRVVGPEVHGWYVEHSTTNPLCALPKDIPVYHGNKFLN